MTEKTTNLIAMLLDYEGWDEAGENGVLFINATFKHDFGGFKKGENYNSIAIMFEYGVMQAFDDEGEVIKTVRFTLTPLSNDGAIAI